MTTTTQEAKATGLTKRQAIRLAGVTLNREDNPKKPGSMSFARFNNYFVTRDKFMDDEGNADFTVQDALDNGVRMDDIRHDSEHGFITLDMPAYDAE